MIYGQLRSLVLHRHHDFSSPSLGRIKGGGEEGWERGRCVLGFLGGEGGARENGLTVLHYKEEDRNSSIPVTTQHH